MASGRNGRGSGGEGGADGMCVLGRVVVRGSMALGFVDLEKAFDTVPREMMMLRWMGVPRAEVGMVGGMYGKITARVVVGGGSIGAV